jgi:DNA-binding NarL/FixJ family response regulator
MKVIIVDDQRLMQDGLKTILDLEEDIEVVATCNNGLEAVKACDEIEVDVVLMDIRMPDLNGVEATKKIKVSKPKIKILILTTFDDDEYIIDGLKNGATGYMLKDIGGDSLIEAIRAAYNDEYILPSKIAQKLVKRLSSSKESENMNRQEEYSSGESSFVKPDDTITKKINNEHRDIKKISIFTERELEIAKMLSEGFTNKQIASALFLSEGTIKNNVSNIYSKIEISDRTAAALYLKEILK